MYSFVKNSGVEVDFIDKFLSCSDQVKPRFRLEDYIALIVFIAAGCFLLTLTIFETKFGTKSVFSGLSLNSSLKGLADTDAPGNEISCLNGFRVICIILVIAYNRLHGMMYLMPSSRRNTIVETLSTVTLRLFEASTISIEIFLLISGTVATYTFFVKKEKQQQLPLWKSYLIRYFRLTPALAVMMLFYATLSIHMSQGPLWPQSAERMENPCRSYWWTGLLHISNYYNADNVCVSQSWYVALVFQLHVLSPLVLIPLYKTPKMWSLWIIPNIVGPVAAMVVKSYVGEFYPGSMLNEIELQRETNYSSAVDYQGFHLKLCYYVIGIGLGYILFLIKHNKKEISFSKPFFTLGWTVSGLVLTAYLSLSLVILHPDHTFRPWFDPLFNGLAKPLTSLALAWVIFACSLGHGGIVNRFLSWSAFRPLARLVYGVYLVHVLVLLTQCYSVQVPQAFTYTEYMFLVFGDITVSFALAVVLYLAVEVPCSKLANNLLTDSKLNEVENVTTQKLPPIVPTLNENMKSSKL